MNASEKEIALPVKPLTSGLVFFYLACLSVRLAITRAMSTRVAFLVIRSSWLVRADYLPVAVNPWGLLNNFFQNQRVSPWAFSLSVPAFGCLVVAKHFHHSKLWHRLSGSLPLFSPHKISQLLDKPTLYFMMPLWCHQRSSRLLMGVLKNLPN